MEAGRMERRTSFSKMFPLNVMVMSHTRSRIADCHVRSKSELVPLQTDKVMEVLSPKKEQYWDFAPGVTGLNSLGFASRKRK